jgi:hypothetical protein
MKLTALLPLRRMSCYGSLTFLKCPSFSAWFEPANLGSIGKHDNNYTTENDKLCCNLVSNSDIHSSSLSPYSLSYIVELKRCNLSNIKVHYRTRFWTSSMRLPSSTCFNKTHLILGLPIDHVPGVSSWKFCMYSLSPQPSLCPDHISILTFTVVRLSIQSDSYTSRAPYMAYAIFWRGI